MVNFHLAHCVARIISTYNTSYYNIHKLIVKHLLDFQINKQTKKNMRFANNEKINFIHLKSTPNERT